MRLIVGGALINLCNLNLKAGNKVSAIFTGLFGLAISLDAAITYWAGKETEERAK